MKEKLTVFLSAMGSLGLFACGGGSGVSADFPVFKTATLTVRGYTDSAGNPISGLESDVLLRRQRTELVNSSFSTGCNQVVRVDNACTGVVFRSDAININLRVEAIKDARGNPLTTPSPLLVRRYSVSFSSCVPGGLFSQEVSQTITEGDHTVLIEVVPSEVKRIMASAIINYTYINADGCQTVFQVPAYIGSCIASARIELEVVELTTGTVRRVPVSLPVRFADFISPDDACTVP